MSTFFKPPNSPFPPKRDIFSSKLGVIAAAAGSAVGLGNIWKFPYVLGNNGGGAFLLLYLFFIVLIGMPVMLSEFSLGRKARRNVHGVFKRLAPGSMWHFVGYMGIGAAFMILAFYGVVAGWSLEYIRYSISGAFVNKTPQDIDMMFDQFAMSPLRPVLWQLIFMGLTAFIVISGVKKGIEKYAKILMPLLFVMVLILAVRSMTLPGAEQGLSFLFKPDFSLITPTSILEALGQAFFSLSLGMGALITYGSYIGRDDNLGGITLQVSVADTVIAVLAGLAIFPAVFAFGINPAEGPGLVYKTLPVVFQQMPGGSFFSFVFFCLLFVAALTSSISLLEVVVAYFVEELKMIRKNATIMAAALISIFGILCSLSLGSVNIEFMGLNFFSLLEFLSSNILLPLGGLLIALFVGWVLGKKRMLREISNDYQLKVPYISILMFLIKFLAPVAIALVFLSGIGLLRF